MKLLHVTKNGQNNKTLLNSENLLTPCIIVGKLMLARVQRGIIFTLATVTGAILSSGISLSVEFFLLPLVTFASSLAAYIMNDIVDIKVDRINAPKRPTASGNIKIYAYFVVIALSALSIIAGYFAGSVTCVLVCINLLLGLFYSIPKVTLKERFVTKTASIGVGGFITMMIGASISGNLIDTRVLVGGISFIGFIFMTSPINDLADLKGDARNGRKTIPIVIGPAKTIILSSIFPCIITLFFWAAFYQLNYGLITPILLSFTTLFALLTLKSISNKKNDLLIVRQKHKKLSMAHFGLQFALMAGIIVL